MTTANYKVGDKVRVHSKEHIWENSQEYEEHRRHIENSKDELCFNKIMVKYCDRNAIVTEVLHRGKFHRYYLDISEKDHRWNDGMITSRFNKKDQEKVFAQLDNKLNIYNEELL